MPDLIFLLWRHIKNREGTQGVSPPGGADAGWRGFKRLDFIALFLPVLSMSTVPFCVGEILLLGFWLRSWARWSCLHMCFHLTFHKTKQLYLNYSEITCVPKGLQVGSGSHRKENDHWIWLQTWREHSPRNLCFSPPVPLRIKIFTDSQLPKSCWYYFKNVRQFYAMAWSFNEANYYFLDNKKSYLANSTNLCKLDLEVFILWYTQISWFLLRYFGSCVTFGLLFSIIYVLHVWHNLHQHHLRQMFAIEWL